MRSCISRSHVSKTRKFKELISAVTSFNRKISLNAFSLLISFLFFAKFRRKFFFSWVQRSRKRDGRCTGNFTRWWLFVYIGLAFVSVIHFHVCGFYKGFTVYSATHEKDKCQNYKFVKPPIDFQTEIENENQEIL